MTTDQQQQLVRCAERSCPGRTTNAAAGAWWCADHRRHDPHPIAAKSAGSQRPTRGRRARPKPADE